MKQLGQLGELGTAAVEAAGAVEASVSDYGEQGPQVQGHNQTEVWQKAQPSQYSSSTKLSRSVEIL